MPAYQIERVVTRLGNQTQKTNPALAAERLLNEPRRRAHELWCHDASARARCAGAASFCFEHNRRSARGGEMKRERQTCDAATNDGDLHLGTSLER